MVMIAGRDPVADRSIDLTQRLRLVLKVLLRGYGLSVIDMKIEEKVKEEMWPSRNR